LEVNVGSFSRAHRRLVMVVCVALGLSACLSACVEEKERPPETDALPSQTGGAGAGTGAAGSGTGAAGRVGAAGSSGAGATGAAGATGRAGASGSTGVAGATSTTGAAGTGSAIDAGASDAATEAPAMTYSMYIGNMQTQNPFQGGFGLSYENMLAPVTSAHANCPNLDASKRRVVPGHPESSLVYIKVAVANLPASCGGHMPYMTSNLAANHIEELRDWILAGAKP